MVAYKDFNIGKGGHMGGPQLLPTYFFTVKCFHVWMDGGRSFLLDLHVTWIAYTLAAIILVV